MKDSNVVLGCIGMVIVAGFMIVFSALLGGYVTMQLWNWLLVPVFETLPTLTLVQSVGVSLVVGYLTKAVVPTKEAKSTGESIGNFVGVVLATPLLTLLIGYIISLFY